MFKSKKAVSELISFVMITLIIVIASTSAYFVSKDVISNKLIDVDRGNMEIYLKKMARKTQEIQNFNNATTFIDFNFNEGQLVFESNQIKYQSLIELSGSSMGCFGIVCSEIVGGYEMLYYNLSNSYVFQDNFSLSPGTYTLIFKNIKNEKKIQVKIV